MTLSMTVEATNIRPPSVRVLALVLLLALFLSNAGCGHCREVNLQSSHSSFLKANYNSGSKKLPRNTWCSNDPGACSRYAPDRSTCCLNRYCTDLSSDSYHCGSCGHACGYGLTCCGRTCVDLNNENAHCGACFNACPYEETCSFGMCGYGYGYGYSQNTHI